MDAFYKKLICGKKGRSSWKVLWLNYFCQSNKNWAKQESWLTRSRTAPVRRGGSSDHHVRLLVVDDDDGDAVEAGGPKKVFGVLLETETLVTFPRGNTKPRPTTSSFFIIASLRDVTLYQGAPEPVVGPYQQVLGAVT